MHRGTIDLCLKGERDRASALTDEAAPAGLSAGIPE